MTIHVLQNVTTNLVRINKTHPFEFLLEKGSCSTTRRILHAKSVRATFLLAWWSSSVNFCKIMFPQRQRAGSDIFSNFAIGIPLYSMVTRGSLGFRRKCEKCPKCGISLVTRLIKECQVQCNWCLRWIHAPLGSAGFGRELETRVAKGNERHVERPRWRRPCYYGRRTPRYVRRKRSKQLVSGPYHKVLSASLTTLRHNHIEVLLRRIDVSSSSSGVSIRTEDTRNRRLKPGKAKCSSEIFSQSRRLSNGCAQL